MGLGPRFDFKRPQILETERLRLEPLVPPTRTSCPPVTHLGNCDSEVLLEQLGFTEEGLLRGPILNDGDRRDCRLFGLLL